MTIIIFGISFIVIWLVATFFIVRYVKRIKDDLLGRFSDTEKPPKENVKPFEYIRKADPKHLLYFIEREHPQIIALVLAHLEPSNASYILQNLHDIQGDVSHRIATMDSVNPVIIREIERILEKKLSTLSDEEYSPAGGVESVIKILNKTDSDTENQIMKKIEDEYPKLAEELKKRL